MERGLYEQLVTEGLQDQLTRLETDRAQTRPVENADQAHVLSRHVEAAVQRVLSATNDPQRRLTIVNALLGTLEDVSDAVTEPASQLLSVLRVAEPGVTTYKDVRPATPLAEAA